MTQNWRLSTNHNALKISDVMLISKYRPTLFLCRVLLCNVFTCFVDVRDHEYSIIPELQLYYMSFLQFYSYVMNKPC